MHQPPGLVQPMTGQLKKRWTESQREQSRRFWEKKDRRDQRRRESEARRAELERQNDPKGLGVEAEKRIRKVIGSPLYLGYSIALRLHVLDDGQFDEQYADAAVYEFRRTDADADEDTLRHVRSAAMGLAKKNHAITSRGNIYVKKDFYELDTVVHEGVHLLGRDFFSIFACNGDSQGINEGMTEYFTRLALNVKKRKPYENEYKTAASIVVQLGLKRVTDAYFFNEIQAFKLAYEEAMGVGWDDDYRYVQALTKGGQKVEPADRR